MESSESRTFAQFGGLLLLVSLVLPYFAISFAGLGSHGFRLWTLDKGAFVLIAAYGLLAIAQLKMSSRESMALIYLICGGLFTAALVYRIWISPPGSTPLGDLGSAVPSGGSGSLTVNGKSAEGLTANDFLEAMGIELKASYGAFVAMLGSVFFTVGAFLEFRAVGVAKAAGPAHNMEQAQPVAAGQRYQPPTPQAYAPVQAASNVPPDPFARPAQPAAPVVPPDPFAPPAQAPAAPPQPYVPPGPPTV